MLPDTVALFKFISSTEFDLIEQITDALPEKTKSDFKK
jgi:hypothetical protein